MHSQNSKHTQFQHSPKIPLSPENHPVVSPIYQTVKFACSADWFQPDQPLPPGKYVYSRLANPSLTELERHLALVCEEEDAVVFATGMGALSAVLLHELKAGDHFLMALESYQTLRSFAKNVLNKFGVTTDFLSIENTEAWLQKIHSGQIKLLILELPTNPICRIPEYEKILLAAKAAQVTTVSDLTFLGLQPAALLGVKPDWVIHSLTKYASGHGDVLGGVALGSKEKCDALHAHAAWIGAALDPHAAFLIERGLKTFPLRFEAISNRAQELATQLNEQPWVQTVFYPSLPTFCDRERLPKTIRHWGGVIALELVATGPTAMEVARHLQVFHFTVSLGATESLATPVSFFYGSDLTTEQQQQAHISPFLLRLSIGLEDVTDLFLDLQQAYQLAQKKPTP